jgi:hypothetical protein
MLDLILGQDFGDEIHAFVDHRLKRGKLIAEGAGLLLGAALAHAEMDAPTRKNVERGDPFGDLDGMVHRRRQADDAVADADPLGAPGDIGKEGLGRRHMRILGERGMLDRPDRIEADFLGEHHLLDDLVEAAHFGIGRRVRHLGFVNDREFHAWSPLRCRACGRPLGLFRGWRRGRHRLFGLGGGVHPNAAFNATAASAIASSASATTPNMLTKP